MSVCTGGEESLLSSCIRLLALRLQDTEWPGRETSSSSREVRTGPPGQMLLLSGLLPF